MKSVLISIQPKWCELIASGKKTVEVRKTKPKLETPFKVYIYCTKVKFEPSECLRNNLHYDDSAIKVCEGQGKVIGEFVCDQIDEIGYSPEMHGKYICDIDDIHYVSCVDFEQMFDYLADGYGYAWHISDLVIYDEPKSLEKFFKPCDGCEKKGTIRCTEESTPCRAKKITRPPQSWCYVEGE